MLLVPQAQKEDCEVDDSSESDEAAEFQIGMSLEAKDRKNSNLVSVATIADIKEGSEMLLIHIDGRDNDYDYWCQSDSTDIHPVGWCEENGEELQVPRGEYESLHVLQKKVLT